MVACIGDIDLVACAGKAWRIRAAEFKVLADDLKIVPDVDMVELRLSRLKPEDCDLWNATEEIAATSNCGINGAIQAYIRTRGGTAY
jgi:hypothetical protein